jgi:ABC-type Na+ transport system ATPase subunit NatA
MKKPEGEQPTFDYGHAGMQWRDQFNENLTSVAEAQEVLNRKLPKSISDEDSETYDEAKVQAFYDRRDAALATIKAAPAKQKELIAQVLVDVPRSWLLDDAPADIDWSDPDNLKYVSYDGYNKLLIIWIQGGGARRNAKN